MTNEEIQRAVDTFNSAERGTPEWMEAFALLDSLGMIDMKVNEEAIYKRIAEMEARGEPILPDTFPGIKLTRKIKGPGGDQSVDNN